MPKAIIPVVADTFWIDDDKYAAPDGIDELIATTVRFMPEGLAGCQGRCRSIQIEQEARSVAKHDSSRNIERRDCWCCACADSRCDHILGRLEIAAITAISKIYGIDKEHGAERFKETIAEVGTVSLAAKGVLSLTKAIPGLNLRLPWRMPWLPEASLQHYVGLQSMLAIGFTGRQVPTMPTG